MPWRSGLLAGMAAIAVMAAGSGAQAQLVWPRGVRSAGLSSQDMKIMNAKTSFLYESGQTAIGQSASWKNPKTGSSGTATLTGKPTLRGMECRTVRYEFSTIRPARSDSYSLNWCHTPQNTWRIVD